MGRGVYKKNAVFPLFFGVQIAVIAAILLLLTGCPLFNIEPSQKGTFESRTFMVQQVDGGNFYEIRALKLAEGARCLVYANTEEALSAGTAMAVANEYDSRIYPKITNAFGDYMAAGYDVDGNGKTILLLLDIKDGYTGSGGYVAGYFDATHLYHYKNSNMADMLFIDVNPQSPGTTGFYATIAHELQHLINYALHGGSPQELWLDEGLSSAAEYLYSGQQWDRIQYFNADYKKTIAQGNNFFVWKGHWEKDEGDTLANYATVYLFFQWLRIQGGGNSIYRSISNSQYRDYQAVTQTAKGWIDGIEETDDSEIWNRLLSSWMIANLVNAKHGLYGYEGELGTQVRYYDVGKPGEVAVQLYPGEGVYSRIAGQGILGDSGNIRYTKIPAEGSQTNTALLTYNANTSPSGGGETGYAYISSLSPSPGGGTGETGTAANSRAVSPAGSGPPRSYPIGINDLWTRRPAEEGEPPVDPWAKPMADPLTDLPVTDLPVNPPSE
jgi:hypothetical protein